MLLCLNQSDVSGFKEFFRCFSIANTSYARLGPRATCFWLNYGILGDLTYLSVSVSVSCSDPGLIKVESYSAMIDHWNMNGVHDILIRSQNSEGLSVNATRMSIGPISNRDITQRVPKNIRGVYLNTNSSFTLTWEPPEDVTELTNYTVFWCVPKPGLQSECEGAIRFAVVPSDQQMFTTAKDQPTLHMAVSANYRTHNTGLRWLICSSDKTDDLAKMEPSIDVTTSTTMTVSWGTERVCAVILAGYNLTYCQRSTGRPDNCTTVVLHDRYTNKHVIQNLVPYTDYSVKMLMYSETRASKYSDELVNRTGEAAPSQPRELQLLRVTSASVELSWKPPLLANGMVRAYEGTFRSLRDNVTENFRVPALISELVDTEKPITHTLGNLTAFTHYEVSVRARTLYPSESSNVVTFRTAIGGEYWVCSCSPAKSNGSSSFSCSSLAADATGDEQQGPELAPGLAPAQDAGRTH